MTWTSFHRRGEILRDVVSSANRRRDGLLPMELTGVAETFGDELSLLGALQLRWHTRLSGRVERELAAEPLDLEDAVVAAWHATADELPGPLAILDRERSAHSTPAVAEAMAKATAKERSMLAMMAGRVSSVGPAAVRAGAEIERRARATYEPSVASAPAPARRPGGLLRRFKPARAA
ncbi:hypothetical protein [Nocardioides sp. YIM 152315]|uniref:hypothetical protein n=1 Tax=Nocardioides sp. YIM 152315 TaxID=3031760 RepID=UPI0023DC868B|nr:hypothetical protein [Nocardioides sp. YIM 152315]MDF1606468.1 hypothetical protein [Nocardioides sp. YIM 152315]